MIDVFFFFETTARSTERLRLGKDKLQRDLKHGLPKQNRNVQNFLFLEVVRTILDLLCPGIKIQFVFYLCGFDWAFWPTKISFRHQNSPPNLWVGQAGLKTIGRCFWIIPVLFLFLLKKTVQISCK